MATEAEIRRAFEQCVAVVEERKGHKLNLERGKRGYADVAAQMAWAWFNLGFDIAEHLNGR